MTPTQLQKDIKSIRRQLKDKVTCSTMDLIEELINLEIELEAHCNQ